MHVSNGDAFWLGGANMKYAKMRGADGKGDRFFHRNLPTRETNWEISREGGKEVEDDGKIIRRSDSPHLLPI